MDKDDKVKLFPNVKRAMSNKADNGSVVHLKKYLGFEYVKIEKDINQISFSQKQLKEYPNNIKYSISISRTKDGKTRLYEYFVEGVKIVDFFKLHIEGKIEGDIIQIDKFSPDNLA